VHVLNINHLCDFYTVLDTVSKLVIKIHF